MRRPSPAPAPRPAPPPGRAAAPGPPPRRGTDAPGRSTPAGSAGTAGTAGSAPPRTRPGPHPAPPRPPGPPRAHGHRRGPIVVAAALTLVILLAFGGYTAWNAITGGGSDTASAPDASDYETIVARNIFFAAQVLGQGIDTRLVADLEAFNENANRVIFTIGLERVALGKLAADATGPQREVIASTQQSFDQLQAALVEWRDAVYNLRLGSVADAHAAIDTAITRLQGDLERWKAATARS